MSKLKEKIKTIPKAYFTLMDIKKVTSMDVNSLRVSMNRLVKNGEIERILRSVYSFDSSLVDWEKMACEIYRPAYVSFESALAIHNVLSQKPMHITLATSNRSRKINFGNKIAAYHHLKEDLFWGYDRSGGFLLADPEKAFLDLAYLASRGYAKMDIEEMNLDFLNKKKLKRYLRKFSGLKMDSLVSFH